MTLSVTTNPAIPECFHSSPCAYADDFATTCISCRDLVSRIFQAFEIIDSVTGMNLEHKKCSKGWTSPVGCFVSMGGLSSMKGTPFLFYVAPLIRTDGVQLLVALLIRTDTFAELCGFGKFCN